MKSNLPKTLVILFVCLKTFNCLKCNIGVSNSIQVNENILSCTELLIFKDQIDTFVINFIKLSRKRFNFLTHKFFDINYYTSILVKSFHKLLFFINSQAKSRANDYCNKSSSSRCLDGTEFLYAFLSFLFPEKPESSEKFLIERYFKIKKWNEETKAFLIDVSKEYFKKKADLLVELHINNLENNIIRYEKNYKQIKSLFFHENVDYLLESVLSMDSDIHKTSGITSLLTLRSINGRSTLKIMSKPSSVLIDFMITGKISEFCKIQDEYFQFICNRENLNDKRSFFEIAIQKDPFLKIKIYKILPIEDFYEQNIGKKIYTAHGYSEYLENQLKDYSLEAGIVQLQKKLESEIKENNNLSKSMLNPQIFENIAKDYLYDHFSNWYSTQKQISRKEKEGLWYTIGYSVAAMVMLSSTDHHQENIVITPDRQIAFIDLENSFSLADFVGESSRENVSVSSTNLFYSQNGGLNCLKIKTDPEDIFFKVGSNVMYLFFDKIVDNNLIILDVKNRVYGIQPDLQFFKQGMENLFEDLGKGQFYKWIQSPILNAVIVREIVLGTTNYFLLTFESSTNIENEVYKLRNSIPKNEYEDRRIAMNQKTISLLKDGIIPSFYALSWDNFLYFADGTQVVDDLSGKVLIRNVNSQYYKNSPIKNIKERFLRVNIDRSDHFFRILKNLNEIIEIQAEKDRITKRIDKTDNFLDFSQQNYDQKIGQKFIDMKNRVQPNFLIQNENIFYPINLNQQQIQTQMQRNGKYIPNFNQLNKNLNVNNQNAMPVYINPFQQIQMQRPSGFKYFENNFNPEKKPENSDLGNQLQHVRIQRPSELKYFGNHFNPEKKTENGDPIKVLQEITNQKAIISEKKKENELKLETSNKNEFKENLLKESILKPENKISENAKWIFSDVYSDSETEEVDKDVKVSDKIQEYQTQSMNKNEPVFKSHKIISIDSNTQKSNKELKQVSQNNEQKKVKK